MIGSKAHSAVERNCVVAETANYLAYLDLSYFVASIRNELIHWHNQGIIELFKFALKIFLKAFTI